MVPNHQKLAGYATVISYKPWFKDDHLRQDPHYYIYYMIPQCSTIILTVSNQKLSLVGFHANRVRSCTSDSHTTWMIELMANTSTGSRETISEGPLVGHWSIILGTTLWLDITRKCCSSVSRKFSWATDSHREQWIWVDRLITTKGTHTNYLVL